MTNSSVRKCTMQNERHGHTASWPWAVGATLTSHRSLHACTTGEHVKIERIWRSLCSYTHLFKIARGQEARTRCLGRAKGISSVASKHTADERIRRDADRIRITGEANRITCNIALRRGVSGWPVRRAQAIIKAMAAPTACTICQKVPDNNVQCVHDGVKVDQDGDGFQSW